MLRSIFGKMAMETDQASEASVTDKSSLEEQRHELEHKEQSLQAQHAQPQEAQEKLPAPQDEQENQTQQTAAQTELAKQNPQPAAQDEQEKQGQQSAAQTEQDKQAQQPVAQTEQAKQAKLLAAKTAQAKQAQLLDVQNKLQEEQAKLLAVKTQLQEEQAKLAQLQKEQAQLQADQAKLQKEQEQLHSDQTKLQEEQAQLQIAKDLQLITEKTFAEQKQQALDEFQQQFAELKKQQQSKLVDDIQAEELAAKQASQERLQQYQRELEEARSSLLAKFSAQEKDLLATQEKQLDDALRARIQVVAQREQNAAQQEQYLGNKEAELNALKQQLLVQQQALKTSQEQIPQLVTEQCAAQMQVMQGKVKDLQQFIEQLKQENSHLSSVIGTYKLLEQKFGGKAPEAILQELKDRELRIADLRRELTERPPRELEQRYAELAAREKQLTASNQELADKMTQMSAICATRATEAYEKDNLRQELEYSQQQLELLSAHNNMLQGEIDRLQSQYNDPSGRAERISALETPYITAEPRLIRQDWGNDADDELRWLSWIAQRCRESGFIFPTRLLHAFHTSLKCSDWSPLTVLAGVSGTGKSKLPQLYSVFGGINFMLLSVQPNWDSQESMLGFFNSIDNVFDAQPVLRFLAQSQHHADENYPYGMRDAVNIVLLDEMNLAHVELYFAEFLSKLELRHGLGAANLPNIEVKIGAKIAPYLLRLGRNVLWVGTMNEDETTKSLSDKVIDRSCILHFPRPKEFNRISSTSLLPSRPDELLPFNVWQRYWQQHDSAFSTEEIAPFKQLVEDINAALAKAGRALGHRVWQSIEAYMANYPAVINLRKTNASPTAIKHAMQLAFEDQLVLKIMPKMRGIETRGVAKQQCLDVIGSKLAEQKYSILDDFIAACELGYGQFMWNSAAYLEKNGEDVGVDLTSLGE
ncbi:MAG: hypothetical protein H9847_03425 [Candidatus Anaerobiospirillum pullicola]|uniref:Chromosome partitioning protein ParA n=1 Tax=Candidatus Anaerobiospirillum pullicola TaxID=2838451 RepID=A0A948TFF9_9GAMM|nr:hypothetical protein [Candidatus Anaerobiospirillum pullicola]